MGELAGEGIWLLLLAVGTSTTLQRHFNGISTALQLHFYCTSTALQRHFRGTNKEGEEENKFFLFGIGASIRIGRESQYLL